MNIAIAILAVMLVAAVVYIVILQNRSASLSARASYAEKALLEQKEFFAKTNSETEERFKSLAQISLSRNSEMIRQQNRQGLQEVLEPMKEDLERFRRQIDETYSREGRERFALGRSIEDLRQLNTTIGEETRRLSDAIKGNTSIQGRWGEMILENILQSAGLRRGEDYEVQVSQADDDGRQLRPDVIVKCPDGLKIIIDSKVSIQAYIRMLDAADDTVKNQYARAHLDSIRKHVAELATKSYQAVAGNRSLDYVLMFVPHEGAYMAAMTLDPDIWNKAFEKGVVIVSAIHLMAVIKLIEQMWRHDRQNRNAVAIAEQAGRMLDKFNGFIADLNTVGDRLRAASNAWEDANKKLYSGRGNLVSSASTLASMGARTKKPLPDGEQ